MKLGHYARRLSGRLPMFNPTGVADAQLSMILYDGHGLPSPRLLELAIQAIQYACTEDLSSISARMAAPPRWPDIWPGEHYKLLAGLVQVLKPRNIIEIGTFQGLSALALAKHLGPGGAVYTYDILPYTDISGQMLTQRDCEEQHIVPILADLTRREVFENNRGILELAEIIFVDAAKDGVMEQTLLDRFETLRFLKPPLLVFDDIRLWSMLRIWRNVTRPKLDLTSFGHWSGTGLIDWQPCPHERR